MSAQTTANESAATLKWLTALLGLDGSVNASPVQAAWTDVRETMHRYATNGQTVLQSVDWVSDYWVARGSRPAPFLNQLAPTWMPPEGLLDWPDLGVGAAIAPLADCATRSNHAAFAALLHAAPTPAPADDASSQALETFHALKAPLVPRLRYTDGVAFEVFVANDEKRAAVERQLFVMGEAAARMAPEWKDVRPADPWRQIVGMRNPLSARDFPVD